MKPHHTLRQMMKNAIGRRLHREQYLLHDRTPREVIYQQDMLSVSVFHPLKERRVVIEGESVVVEPVRPIPLLLVPPLGVYAWIFDLMTDRSLARYFLARGFAVYLVDFGTPSGEHSHLSMADYALKWLPQAVKAVQQHSGQAKISMLGYCMGGLLSLIYTAARGRDAIQNIITIASPVNMHQMSGVIGRGYQMLSGPSGLVKRWTGHELLRLDPQYFHIDGKLLSILFRLSQPAATVKSYLDLVRHLADDDYVKRYMTMNEWFSHMPDYPGATVQEMIGRLGLANGMAEGRFKIGTEVVDLADIHCSVLAFAGAQDAITSISSACALMGVVSANDLTFEVVNGGHAGVFTGSKAAHTTWAIAADWLALRSDLQTITEVLA